MLVIAFAISGKKTINGYSISEWENITKYDIGLSTEGRMFAFNGDEDLAKDLGLKGDRREDLLDKAIECYRKRIVGEEDEITEHDSIDEIYATILLEALQDSVDGGNCEDTTINNTTDTTDNNTKIEEPIINNTAQIDESVGSGFNASIIPDSNEGQIDASMKMVGDRIASTVFTVLRIIAFAGIIIVGLKYMFTSADQKADIKMSVTYLIAGMVLVFGASTVANFSIDVVKDFETAQEEAILNDQEQFCKMNHPNRETDAYDATAYANCINNKNVYEGELKSYKKSKQQ